MRTDPSQSKWTLLFVAVLGTSPGLIWSAPDERPLPKIEIAKRGKATTGLLLSGRSAGTAFCINSTGLFLASSRVVRSAGEQPTRLILNPGLKTQQVLNARVIRSDPTLDLALLKVKSKENLPVLSLGSTAGLTELAEMVALGFPTDRRPNAEKQEYPSVNARAGTISSLQRSRGELTRIEVDANPGLPGGPVLDRQGKIVGVVSTVSANRSYVVPVNQIKAFVSKPYVLFTPPLINRRNVRGPVPFEVQAGTVIPSKKPLQVELKVVVKGHERTFRMKQDKGSYSATVVPVPVTPQKTVRLTVTFREGSVEGLVENRSFKVGATEVKLSEVWSVRFGDKVEVTTINGQTLVGALSDLEKLVVGVGRAQLNVSLLKAMQLSVAHPKPPSQVESVVVIRQQGKIIEQIRTALPVHERLLLVLPAEIANSLAFSPDGKRIATSSRDQSVKVWDSVTGKHLFSCRGHTDSVRTVAYSPDGKRIVTGSSDKTIRIWDAVTGK